MLSTNIFSTLFF